MARSYIRSIRGRYRSQLRRHRGDNTPWTRGTDPFRLLKLTQCFWDEADQAPAYLPDGSLITAIRTFKNARAYENVALVNSVSETAIAECWHLIRRLVLRAWIRFL